MSIFIKPGLWRQGRKIIKGELDLTKLLTTSTSVETLKVKRTLTAAELSTSFSIPIDVIPAPGPGKLIVLMGCVGKLNFGSIAYDIPGFAGSLGFQTGTSLMQIPGSVINNTSNVIEQKLPTGGGFSLENTSLKFIAQADPTQGDSTLDLYITYEIITL